MCPSLRHPKGAESLVDQKETSFQEASCYLMLDVEIDTLESVDKLWIRISLISKT